uniref:Uncharacterized protein n=1 Tax=Arundo donax TaxID=35708 RepID=A0A0A9FH17_ARUDO
MPKWEACAVLLVPGGDDVKGLCSKAGDV